ncbi:uncharacterized protein, partial [Primulina eburnea]|uniref:uncharacterized protein n=1 Tax=Primulina eburnea TaxID=1245227 RepID=UPI003C6C08C6
KTRPLAYGRKRRVASKKRASEVGIAVRLLLFCSKERNGSSLKPHFRFLPPPSLVLIVSANSDNNMGFGDRGIIGDKWSSKILWLCAIGSAIGLYMVAVERQLQNREKMMSQSLRDADAGK